MPGSFSARGTFYRYAAFMAVVWIVLILCVNHMMLVDNQRAMRLSLYFLAAVVPALLVGCFRVVQRAYTGEPEDDGKESLVACCVALVPISILWAVSEFFY